MRICSRVALVAMLFLMGFWGSSAFAQYAELSGRVTDPNGLPVPKVKVEAVNVLTNVAVSAETNDAGLYYFPNLQPAIYRVLVEKEGFDLIVKPHVELHVEDHAAINFQLRVGSMATTVTVEGGAPLINTESGAVSTVVDRQFVANMPLNGRSFQSLIALTPGVVLTKASQAEQGQFSVNGQRANSNYFTVDGVSANVGGGLNLSSASGQQLSGALPGLTAAGGTNNLVSVDALQEFRIQTSTFAPEFGRTPGGQISIVSRSGTNEFHGSLFDYFRNDALDANDWFANANSLSKPALRQNDFGGVLGGPVFLPRFGEHTPRVYNGRNRTFFFFSYEGLRLRQPVIGIMDVPAMTVRQSAVPSIQPFLNAFPVPNGPASANGFAKFSASFSNPLNLNSTSFRIDHTISNRLTLFGRYSYAPSEIARRGSTISLNTLLTNGFNTEALTFGASQMITGRISNELRVNYTKNEGSSSELVDNFGGALVPPDTLFFPLPTLKPGASQLCINSGSLTCLISGSRGRNLQRQINIVDNLSLAEGNHQAKVGIDYRRLSPVLGQSTTTTVFADFATPSVAATGIASDAGTRATLSEKIFPVFTNISIYGQDTWRLTPRLTLTYGLRWEYNPPPTEKNGNNPFAATGTDNPLTLAIAPRGTRLYKTKYNNFAPRFGGAYKVSQRQGRETVLRGGFGVFYDVGNTTTATGFLGEPFVATKVILNVPFPLSSKDAAPPIISLNPPYSTLFLIDPNLRLPYTYQWNLAVEQSAGSNQTVSASYVAALGHRLLREELLTGPILSGNPSFSSSARVTVTRNTASSEYHAMQLQYNRRLSRSLQALASYTWSKSLDNASLDSAGFIPSEKIDPQLNRGPSDYDVRHAFSAAITYDIAGPRIGKFGDGILRGWSIDTLVTARSATPVDVIYSRNIGFGFFSFRPDSVPGIALYINDPTVAGGRRINPAAFVIPTAARQGTLGRNALRGFPVSQVDFALRRQFSLTEHVNLQFRAEFFNIFNHPNFADPVGIFTSGQFGLSTSTLGGSLGSTGLSGFNPLYQIGSPRSIQFSLKLQF